MILCLCVVAMNCPNEQKTPNWLTGLFGWSSAFMSVRRHAFMNDGRPAYRKFLRDVGTTPRTTKMKELRAWDVLILPFDSVAQPF